MPKKIVIVGAGFGGLSTAALLAKEGHKVTVLEKNSSVGGRALSFTEKGFTFDMGPSWYLMPEIFDDFFAHFGKKTSDYYKLKRLDPSYRIFYDNQKPVDISANKNTNYKLFNKLEKDGGKKLKKYLKESKEIYETAVEFMKKPYNYPKDYLDINLLLKAHKLKIFESLESLVNKNFTSALARKILLFNIVFLGTSPNKAPAMYSLLAHADFGKGVYYPIGGFKKWLRGLRNSQKKTAQK